MNNSIKAKTVLLSCLMLSFCSCTEVSMTGRKQLNFVPDYLIHNMSFNSYRQFLSENKLSTNDDQRLMVRRVGIRIQKALEQYCSRNDCLDELSDYRWEFNLVEDPAINAWAMPGGKVVVYTGLLKVAQNETGLAVVMGHEIAHAFAKHGAERMSHGLLVETGSIALAAALENKPEQTQKLFMQSYGLGTQIGILLPYSREHESEADHLGLIFMAMAGYNPQEAVAFWQRMAASKQGAAPPEFLSTHPADAKRINKIKELMPQAMRYYKPK
ncbi:MAG: M48 family metallopeptidase [Planctomycetota bacterium]